MYHGVKWWYVRLNAGGVATEGHYVRLAPKGTPDGVLFYYSEVELWDLAEKVDSIITVARPIFIEYKRPGGKLSASQVEFKEFVESMGYEYYKVQSLDELMAIEGLAT